MARTVLTPAAGVTNGGVTPSSTAIAGIVSAGGAVIANANPEKLVIRVANTHSSDHPVTVVAGDSLYPAIRSGLGDLAIVVPATSGIKEIVGLESARFLQSDGSLLLNFDASMTGTVEVTYLP